MSRVQGALHCRTDVHDVAVAIDHHLLGDMDGAYLCHPSDIVAGKIKQHQVLGELFRITKQISGKLRVLFGRGAPFARAHNGSDRHGLVAQADENFRA